MNMLNFIHYKEMTMNEKNWTVVVLLFFLRK